MVSEHIMFSKLFNPLLGFLFCVLAKITTFPDDVMTNLMVKR